MNPADCGFSRVADNYRRWFSGDGVLTYRQHDAASGVESDLFGSTMPTAVNCLAGSNVLSVLDTVCEPGLWGGIRPAGRGLLAATGVIHLDLLLTACRSIPTGELLFLFQVIAAFVLAAAVALSGRTLAGAAGARFAFAMLAGYLLPIKACMGSPSVPRRRIDLAIREYASTDRSRSAGSLCHAHAGRGAKPHAKGNTPLRAPTLQRGS